jgi:2,4'-dihydroxyacetophenone dioxygenase
MPTDTEIAKSSPWAQHVMRTETTGVVARHRHASPVHGYVIDDDAPGHTLFWISGAMLNVDEQGEVPGYADVFTRIEEARRHFESVGLGGDYVKNLIR